RTVQWDPPSSIDHSNGCMSPALALGHELAHADQFDTHPFRYMWDKLHTAGAYDNREEQRVITGPEAHAANTLGEATRNDHHPAFDNRERTPTSHTCSVGIR